MSKYDKPQHLFSKICYQYIVAICHTVVISQ